MLLDRMVLLLVDTLHQMILLSLRVSSQEDIVKLNISDLMNKPVSRMITTITIIKALAQTKTLCSTSET